MKTAVWYTSTLIVTFIYLYCYLVHLIRGAEIRHLQPPALRRIGDPSIPPNWSAIKAVGQHQLFAPQGIPQSPPVAVYRDYLPSASAPPVTGAPSIAYENIVPVSPPAPPPLDFEYHNYDQMTDWMKKFSAAYSNLTALYSIGKSVQGRDLWVMVVSISPFQHMKGKPDIKYVANIHGNEAVGREMSLHLIEFLVKSYREDDYVRWLLDQTRIHVLPSLNPDGFEVAREGTCSGGQGRYNARGFDLNRNFPDYFKQNTKRLQPETEAYKEWISKIQFTLSAGLHGGALVASYPFDNTPNSVYQAFSSTPSLTPDDDVFQHLAGLYAQNHASMHQGLACKPGAPSFVNGTTNGASWYPLTGGAQDYSYVWAGTMEITVEMSCCKYPPAAELPVHWNEHRQALVRFMGEAHKGVRGFVTDLSGRPLENVAMKIKGRDAPFQTTKHGEFWRILLPGYYRIEAYKEGYEPVEDDFTVAENHAAQINITLYKMVETRHDFGEFESASSYYSMATNNDRPGNKRIPAVSSNKQETSTGLTGLSGLFISLKSTLSNMFG